MRFTVNGWCDWWDMGTLGALTVCQLSLDWYMGDDGCRHATLTAGLAGFVCALTYWPEGVGE